MKSIHGFKILILIKLQCLPSNMQQSEVVTVCKYLSVIHQWFGALQIQNNKEILWLGTGRIRVAQHEEDMQCDSY